MLSNTYFLKRNYFKVMIMLLLFRLDKGNSILNHYITANLSAIGYNYAISLNIGSKNITPTSFIVDSGNGAFTVLNSNISSNDVTIIENNSECTFLNEDGTSVLYYSASGENAFVSCSFGKTIASIGGASISTNITIAKFLEIENPNLHPWYKADGDIGVAYCFDPYYGPCYLSSFQALLMNASGYDAASINMVYQGAMPFPSSLIFGLNLNPTSHLTSAMQLGFVEQTYKDTIVWETQGSQYPQYHNVFISDLTICGQNIISPMANTWGVLIDTGSVCLTLPEEIYNIFMAWIDLSPISNANMLPVFSFSFSNQNFYIPLSSLVVNVSMITFESGAPSISINGIMKSICILQGNPVSSSGSTTYDVSNIIFGTMVLQNIYFAADFGKRSVGFASKISAAEISQFSTASCMAPANCEGSTTLNNATNSCSISCNSFIFTAYNEKTKSCTYSNSAAGMGLFILFVIISLEIISFFVMQYSAIQLLEGNGNIRRSNIFGITKIDRLTYFAGKKLTSLVDYLSKNNDEVVRPQAQNVLSHRV